MMEPGRNRGRPPLVDEDDLRARAIDVLREHGYSAVTMSRIADEVGVSVRTLHRYFPAKADIVWGGIEGSIDALRASLRHADDRLAPFDAITAVVVQVFEQDADALAVGRARMRIIATEPNLESTRPETYRQWREETAAFFARRLGLTPDDLIPQSAAAAVLAAIMAGIGWWAVQDDETLAPVTAVKRALGGLGAVTGVPAGP
ncbi:TetR family transcriptional regulator [Leifsonia sp. NPDC058194]|uniref:acyl-CoA-like ligand-binding transcription factor n=1 Tax=Leifsonia sp. NPDC058194 TaxID=3346374 RepID=UPI0036DBD73C